MSLFHISMVVRFLEKIQRDFLWGGGNSEQKPHLVNWVFTHKFGGGLGVWRLDILNRALFGKWSCCFVEQRRALWCVLSRVSM